MLKHFRPSDNATSQAVRRYAPNKGEEGLKLEAVIGCVSFSKCLKTYMFQ